MGYTDIHQLLRERQEQAAALWCTHCRCEIYPQEAYYVLSGRAVCSACLQSFAPELLWRERRFAPDPEEIAP